MSSKNDAKTGSITDDSVSTGRVVDGDGGGDVDGASNARDGGSVTPSEPMPTAHNLDRRGFIKGLGVAGAAGVGLSGRAPGSPVGSADALPPLLVGGIAGAAVVGRFVRETNLLLADSPAEGLTADVLEQVIYETARARKSNNESTIVDNQNLADGVKHNAYTEGKIAAIEMLNQEASQSEVQDAALDAVNSYSKTVLGNLIKSWNEGLEELDNLITRLDQHPELSRGDVLNATSDWEVGTDIDIDGTDTYHSYTFADGDTIEVWGYGDYVGSSGGDRYTAEINEVFNDDGDVSVVLETNAGTVDYYQAKPWADLFTSMETAFNDVSDGLSFWVDEVYGEVQSGDIDVSDLLTPREQAELLSDDEEYPQAVADLIALNIPVDPDREATISFTERDITISGLMAPTSPPENGFVSGETYDPSAEPWDLYFTYDPSRGAGGWSEVEPDIPEGELTFTDEPFEEVLYRLSTTTGDTVEVTAADFEESESGGTWTADVSEQVSPTVTEWTDYETAIDGGEVTFTSLPDVSATFVITANDGGEETVSASDFSGSGPYTVDTSLGIAEISEVEATIERTEVDPEETTDMFSEDGSASYETVQISESFTIDRIEDSDGNEVQESEFSRSEPQDDENYITQEEWDELEEQNQELIDKYEEAASSDDGFFGGGGFGDIDIGDIGGSAAVVGAVVAVGAYGVLRTAIKFYIPGK